MSHLSSERLAELADGELTVAEAEHLAACAICATERSAHQRLLTLAGDERDRVAPPLTDWTTLAARLRDEGIIADGAALDAASDVTSAPTDPRVVPLVAPRRHRGAWLAGLRVAAGLIIAATFGALGRISAGASPAPSGREVALTLRQVVGGGGDAGEGLLPQFGAPSGSTLAEMGAPFASVDDALETLSSSQREYDRAVAFIAAHDSTVYTPGARDVYRTRLAALDEMAETSRLALSEAPTDPVLNQYYISTLGAREVTLRQLGSVLTPGKRLSRF
jgi:hypothetical protein